MASVKVTFSYRIKQLLGLDNDWKRQFDNETSLMEEEIREQFAKKNLLRSGMVSRQTGLLQIKRAQERRDEERKRLIEGLSVIPSWLALILSIIAILVSILQ